MTFAARTYPDIVSDVLTAVTRGVVGEAVTVPPEYPDDHLFFLTSRPVRRVSRVDGWRSLDASGKRAPWRFTETDWELVSSTGRPDELDALRFRPRGYRPAPGSVMNVSYWPRETPPLPLTDLNVGSVTRTLLETLAREIADAEAQLQIVYDSAFVETATDRSLERVVALLGISRYAADIPRGKVRFLRGSASPGQLTIPVGTEVLSADGARYATTREALLQRGETGVEVAVAGADRTTALVEAGALDRLARAIAGIDQVGNDAPTYRAAAAETDEELRARARRAFHGIGRGTRSALEHGVGGLGVVSGVEVEELPDGQAGVVNLNVAFVEPGNPEHAALVADTIEALRPAGIRVNWRPAAAVDVVVDVTSLVLTGSSRPTAEVEAARAGLTERLAGAIRTLPPGGRLSSSRVAALALADEAVADIELRFTVAAESGRSEIALPPGTTARPVTPFAFPTVTYAEAAGGPPSRLEIRVLAPVQLLGSTTLPAAEAQIKIRADTWLKTATVLAFAEFAAAVRDDSAYGLVLEESALVLESEGRFEQIVEGSPDRPLAANESATLVGVDLEEVS